MFFLGFFSPYSYINIRYQCKVLEQDNTAENKNAGINVFQML